MASEIDETTLETIERAIVADDEGRYIPRIADPLRALLVAYREQAAEIEKLRMDVARLDGNYRDARRAEDDLTADCERLEAQLAVTRAALEDVVSVLADYRAAGVAFNDGRLSYVEVQVPRVVVADAEAVLSRAAALLALGGKEG